MFGHVWIYTFQFDLCICLVQPDIISLRLYACICTVLVKMNISERCLLLIRELIPC